MRFSTITAITITTSIVSAHGNHDIAREIAVREAMFQYTARDLSHCAAKMKARGLEERAIKRRANIAAELTQKRGIKGMFSKFFESLVLRKETDDAFVLARDVASVLATDHNETTLGYTLDTAESTIFASNGSCVLTPEGESGPYCELCQV